MTTWEEIDGALAALEQDAANMHGEMVWAEAIASHVGCTDEEALRLVVRIVRAAREIHPGGGIQQQGIATALAVLIGHKLGRGAAMKEMTGD